MALVIACLASQAQHVIDALKDTMRRPVMCIVCRAVTAQVMVVAIAKDHVNAIRASEVPIVFLNVTLICSKGTAYRSVTMKLRATRMEGAREMVFARARTHLFHQAVTRVA